MQNEIDSDLVLNSETLNLVDQTVPAFNVATYNHQNLFNLLNSVDYKYVDVDHNPNPNPNPNQNNPNPNPNPNPNQNNPNQNNPNPNQNNPNPNQNNPNPNQNNPKNNPKSNYQSLITPPDLDFLTTSFKLQDQWTRPYPELLALTLVQTGYSVKSAQFAQAAFALYPSLVGRRTEQQVKDWFNRRVRKMKAVIPVMVPGVVPVMVPDVVPVMIPDVVPDKVPERVPERLPERVPERLPERLPERVPERLPERVPERLPERVPERLPERLPERVPERLPERVPDKIVITPAGLPTLRIIGPRPKTLKQALNEILAHHLQIKKILIGLLKT